MSLPDFFEDILYLNRLDSMRKRRRRLSSIYYALFMNALNSNSRRRICR